MNSLREFIGSSSGLAPMRQGLGWVIIALAGLVVLLGDKEAQADRCGDSAYEDCEYNVSCESRNENTPIRCRTEHLDCSFEYHCISRSEAEQAGAFLGPPPKTECSYFGGCARSSNSAKPYRYCTFYYDADGDLDYWQCACSSTPCSEAEQPTATAVQTSSDARPVQHRLGASYPNPFNPAMVIPLALATDEARVHLALYDVLGRRVRQVWDGPLRAGSHRFVWDGRDAAGRDVAAGVYVYKVNIGGQVEAKKTTKLP